MYSYFLIFEDILKLEGFLVVVNIIKKIRQKFNIGFNKKGKNVTQQFNFNENKGSVTIVKDDAKADIYDFDSNKKLYGNISPEELEGKFKEALDLELTATGIHDLTHAKLKCKEVLASNPHHVQANLMLERIERSEKYFMKSKPIWQCAPSEKCMKSSTIVLVTIFLIVFCCCCGVLLLLAYILFK
jgi:hypothetical protein